MVYLRLILNLGSVETVLVLLLWKMFDSQDFMGLHQMRHSRAWELRAMGERATQSYLLFFFLRRQSHISSTKYAYFVSRKNLCKDQVFANIQAM